MLRRCQGLVRGEVQGVGFRHFTRRVAGGLGLGGWVRNNWDGSVEFEAEGPSDRIAQFLEQVRQGPRSAVVTELVLSSDQTVTTPAFTGFEVRF